LSALSCLLRPFPSRLVPVGSDCASQRRAVSRGSVHLRLERRVGVRSGRLGQDFRSERQAGVGSERCSFSVRLSSRRGGPESEAGVVPAWLGLPVGEPGRSRKRASFLLGQAFQSKRRVRVRSEHRSYLARPSSQRGGPESEAMEVSAVLPWPSLPVGESGQSQKRWKRASFLLG